MHAIIVEVGVDHLTQFSDVFSKGALDPTVDDKLAAKTTTLLLPLIFKSENKYDELKVVIDSDLVCPLLPPLELFSSGPLSHIALVINVGAALEVVPAAPGGHPVRWRPADL